MDCDIEMQDQLDQPNVQVIDNTTREKPTKPLSLFTTNYMLRQKFGLGVALYFDFLYYVMISNLIIGGCMMFAWMIQIEFSSVITNPLNLLYIESYGSGVFNYYFFFITGILFALACFAQGLFYYFTRRKIIQREYEKEKLLMDLDPDFVSQVYMPSERDTDGKLIERSKSSWINRKFWKVLSYCIFFVFTFFFCALIGTVTYFRPEEDKIQQYVDGTLDKIGFPMISFYDLLISVILYCFYQILKLIAQLVSLLEKHKKYIGYVKDRTIKFFIGKICLVMTIYIINRINNSDSGCPLSSAGATFFTIVLTDLVLTNVFGILVPLLQRRFPIIQKTLYKGLRVCMPCIKGFFDSDDVYPQFQIETEYFEIYFRQFNIFVGSTTSPVLMLLGSLSFAIEYCCDKTKLVKFCYQSKKTPGLMIRFNQWFLTFTFVLSFFLWPYGGFWIISGDLFGLLNKNYCDCALFRSNSNFLFMQC